jgi:AAA15 family ATPase/GTPase
MITLKQVTIHKYRSFFAPQTFEVDEKITVLVGMNESGKTAALQALAKTNYFQEDKQFKVDLTQDYPRKELTKFRRQEEKNQLLIECRYEISGDYFGKLNEELEGGKLKSQAFTQQLWYQAGEKYSGIELEIASPRKAADEEEEGDAPKAPLTEASFIEQWIKPALPKFWYYDQYFEIEDNISLHQLSQNAIKGQAAQTAQALLDIAGIEVKEVLNSAKINFEDYVAQLEAAAEEISGQIFQYWSANDSLEVKFDINAKEENQSNNQRIVDRILSTRIRNRNYGVTLPLGSRSRGFNWFFSFLVWFSQIENDSDATYILLHTPRQK